MCWARADLALLSRLQSSKGLCSAAKGRSTLLTLRGLPSVMEKEGNVSTVGLMLHFHIHHEPPMNPGASRLNACSPGKGAAGRGRSLSPQHPQPLLPSPRPLARCPAAPPARLHSRVGAAGRPGGSAACQAAPSHLQRLVEGELRLCPFLSGFNLPGEKEKKKKKERGRVNTA